MSEAGVTRRGASTRARSPRRARPTRTLIQTLLWPLAAGLVVLAAWEAVCRAGIVPAFFLPAPSAIAARVASDLAGGSMTGFLGTTIGEALGGAALAAAIALPLGYATAKSRAAALVVGPYAAASQAIPAIAIAPLLVLWIGYGFVPITILCALLVFFPILLNTSFGLQHVESDLIDAARLDGAGAVDLLVHIEAPLALPAILTGLRNGLTLSLTGAVVGEFVMGGTGLGMVLDMQRRNADTTGLFATLTLLVLCAVAVYGAISAIERLVKDRQ